MENFVFTPENGFENSAAYPDPTSEAEAREMLFRPMKQMQTFMNDSVVTNINALYGMTGDASAVSELIAQITQMKADITTSIREQILSFYPVGSVYISTSSVAPSTLFGGTWRAINGRFLLGSDASHALGTIGGEEKHQLTVEELPKHNHKIQYTKSDGGTLSFGYDYSSKGAMSEFNNSGIADTGGNEPHNNMPPYLTVNMWERIA